MEKENISSEVSVGSNRRKFIRLVKTIPIKFTIVQREGEKKLPLKEYEAIGKNIGEGGMFIETTAFEEEFLSELRSRQYRMNLTISLPEQNTEIKTLAQVVWVKKEEKPLERRYGVGMKFVEMPSYEKNRLSSYISEMIEEQQLIKIGKRKKFVVEKTIYLHDTNIFGNAYFSRYFDWQGIAREEFFKRITSNYRKFMQSDIKFITVNASMEYKYEATLFDTIVISVRPTNVKLTTLDLVFTFVNKETGQLIATGKQKVGFATRSNKIIPIPKEIVEKGKDYLNEDESKKIKIFEERSFR